MLVVHHLNNSRSQRILWLLEELGVPYEIKFYERDKKTMLAPESLKKIHPLGKSPVVTDGENVLAESGAIIEYLVNKYGQGKLKPLEGTKESLRYSYWLHYAEGSAMPPLLLSLVFMKIETSPMPFFVKPIAKAISAKVKKDFIGPQLKTHFDYIESELTKNKWFAGSEFSAADIQMSFPLEAAKVRGVLDPKTHPKSLEFLNTIHSTATYKKALDKGGPYDFSH
jgi:glutathione S-transferase